MGAAQKQPRHGGQVQAAYRRQNGHRVAGVRMMQGQGLPQHPLFRGEVPIRQAAAPARYVLHGGPGQGRQHGGGGGGVADAHFPHAHGVYALLLGHVGQVKAHGQGPEGLLLRHGGLCGNVAGGEADLPVQHLGAGHRHADAHVHHLDLVAEVRRQGGHAGFVPGHVHRLLHRHRLGGAGYALRHHAVVRRQHRYPAPVDPGPGRSPDAGQPDGHVLQGPQAARGLGQLRLPPPGGVHGLPVCRENGLYICCQFLPCHVFAPYPCCRSQSRDGPQS